MIRRRLEVFDHGVADLEGELEDAERKAYSDGYSAGKDEATKGEYE